jgi:pimeloyl-ACP methyl ester carboxylesterase
MQGVSLVSGILHHTGKKNRLPQEAYSKSNIVDQPGVKAVLVHGFNFDPTKANKHNPMEVFEKWRRWVPIPTFTFSWHSRPTVWEAWKGGDLFRYHKAWHDAEKAADALASFLLDLECPVVLIGHSLGSRVICQALVALQKRENVYGRQNPVSRVILLNGAESSLNAAMCVAVNPEIDFYNIQVHTDWVLKVLGSLFTPGVFYQPVVGHHGLPDLLPNWHDIILDDPATHEWGKQFGWDLKGDNPRKISDHWYSFTHEGNHGLLKALVLGADLNLTGVAIE